MLAPGIYFYAGGVKCDPKSFDGVDENSLSIAETINFLKLVVKFSNVKSLGKLILLCAKNKYPEQVVK